MQSLNEQGKTQRQKTKRIMGMTPMQITVLAILSCCSFTTIGALAWMVLSNSALPTTSQPLAPTSFPTHLSPTAQPIPTLKTETVPSVLEGYGFVVSERNNDTITYEAPCGSSAILSKSTPEAVAFSIPLKSSVCDLTDVMQPVMNSLYTLYPIAIGDWLINENRLDYVLAGGTASDEVEGYIVVLNLMEDDNSLLYFIRAP